MVTVHTGAETIQGRKLFKGGNYMRKYGSTFVVLHLNVLWENFKQFKIQILCALIQVIQFVRPTSLTIIDLERLVMSS